MFRLTGFLYLILFAFWSCSTPERLQPQPNPWTLNTIAPTPLSGYRAITGGTVEVRGGDPVIKKGVCWSRTLQLPTINVDSIFRTNDGFGGDGWSSTISGLTPKDTILVRAYVLTQNGTFYGETEGYRVPIESKPPTVVTYEVTDPRKTSAPLSGRISTDGGANISERGFWLLNTSTQTSQHISLPLINPDSLDPNFDTIIPGLQSNTTYEVKAFARNKDFPTRQYGESRFFFTNASKPDAFPVVQTDTITVIPDSAAVIATGMVLSPGDFQVLSKGICYGTSRNPGFYGLRVDDPGSPFLPFVNVTISDLIPGIRYYYRAYSRNEAGIGYGAEKSFVLTP